MLLERSEGRLILHTRTARMKRAFAIAFLIVSGCGSGSPVVVSVPAPVDALDCALAEAVALGYTVESAESGVFFEAERPMNGIAFAVLNASAVRGALTVTASTDVRSADSFYTKGPSRGTTSDAEAIVETCAAGAPTAGRQNPPL